MYVQILAVNLLIGASRKCKFSDKIAPRIEKKNEQPFRLLTPYIDY